jgi:hypothetical protein
MDDKGQMMVIESVIFAITVLLALVFLYQMSPTSTVSNTYTNDLKIKGDDALRTLYNDQVTTDLPQSFPKSKLIYYLISDDYDSLITSNLQNMLPSNTMYNIYISNGTQTVFWCSSALDNQTALPLKEPITISHYVIAIHPQFMTNSVFKDMGIIDSDGCEIPKLFNNNYNGSVYDVILEMCLV